MKKECDDSKEMCMCECCRKVKEVLEEIEKQMSPHKKEQRNREA